MKFLGTGRLDRQEKLSEALAHRPCWPDSIIGVYVRHGICFIAYLKVSLVPCNWLYSETVMFTAHLIVAQHWSPLSLECSGTERPHIIRGFAVRKGPCLG